MRSTRLVRYAAEKATGFLIPERTSMDIFASAANAVINLFGSEDKRRLFVNSVNSGVILPEILGQANFGYFRILALYDELDSPTLKSLKVDEFLEGVKPALAEFNQVQCSLMKKIAVIAEEGVDDPEQEEIEESELNMALAVYADIKDDDRLRRLLKYSWKKEAENNSESDEARLMAMVTPEFFERLQYDAKCRYISVDPYVECPGVSVEIKYVALLSARGMLMPSDEAMEDSTVEEAKEKVTDVENAKAKNVAEEKESGVENLSVVAQLEVLYNLEESGVAWNKAESEEKIEFTRSSSAVGVFEGWLNGDPQGRDLQWRVAAVRPAWEFPFLD